MTAQDYCCGTTYGLRSDCGWVINLNLGAACTSYGVAVRGRKIPDAQSRFIDNGDGTVTDTFLKVMWQKNQNECKSYDDELKDLPTYNFAGYNNWRLPTMHELNSTFDESFGGGSWYSNFNFGYDGYYGYYAEKTMMAIRYE